MKITCKNCGADFDSSEMQAGKCPYCGVSVVAANDKNNDTDNFFDNIIEENDAPVYVPVAPEYHCSYPNDAKANKACKNVFSFVIVLLVLVAIRVMSSLATLSDISDSKALLPDLVGTVYYAPYSSYISIATCEVIMHFVLLAVMIVMTVFAKKASKVKFPLSDTDGFGNFKKCFYVSIAALVLTVIYFAIEIAAICVTIEIETLLDESIINASFGFGSVAGSVLILVLSILTLVAYRSLSVEKK